MPAVHSIGAGTRRMRAEATGPRLELLLLRRALQFPPRWHTAHPDSMLAWWASADHLVRHTARPDPMLARRASNDVRHASAADSMLAGWTSGDDNVGHAGSADPMLTRRARPLHAAPGDADERRPAAALRGPPDAIGRTARPRHRNERHELPDALLAPCVRPLAGGTAHTPL